MEFTEIHIIKNNCKLNYYSQLDTVLIMSYDPRSLIDRFLRLNKLNMPGNYLPSPMYPLGINPPTLLPKDKSKLTIGSVTDNLQDLPNTSHMGTELLDDLRARQEAFLKRIRKKGRKHETAAKIPLYFACGAYWYCIHAFASIRLRPSR